ncbi:unnamed protein product [Bursaphelenchus okinawaensis]|uniref:Uncharacterized protein n=1 Tax=Bursaphelenchus okinawaensis TaxID=465554 RepID=A0A811LTH0_9BILA|nr:unnamed protein product [Bursaphelenchus okinawaensis]CAG9128284.1 unnamed protein product [Bursaphelenchus okinawaensis]
MSSRLSLPIRRYLTYLLIVSNLTSAWLNGYNQFNNLPRYRSGGYGGGYGSGYSSQPYGNQGGEDEREAVDDRYGAPCNPNAFTVPSNCLGNNMVKALKNLAHVPPGSNTTFIPLGQVLIPTGKELTFCRNQNNNCGSYQGQGMQPDCYPDGCPCDDNDYNNQGCCGPCNYCRRYFAVHRRRRSIQMQRRFVNLKFNKNSKSRAKKRLL